MNRSSQQGFTLIELIAVIVLLGILAVTALPRFLNVQSDARISLLKGLVGSMQGAAQQTYAKSLIQGKTAATAGLTVTSNGLTISVYNGFPRANTPGAPAVDITSLVNISGTTLNTASDLKFAAVVAGNTTRLFGFDTNADTVITNTDTCYGTYNEGLTNGFPTITLTSTGGC